MYYNSLYYKYSVTKQRIILLIAVLAITVKELAGYKALEKE